MVTQLATKEEMNEMQRVFTQLDKNSDGKLSEQELFDGYKQIYGEVAAREEVNRIMEIADTDKNGTIDYSEFVSATLNKNNLLSENRLD